jgi:hypothetical protein
MVILSHVKAFIGVPENTTSFDLEILSGIQTAFIVLSGLGVSELSTFVVTAESEWTDIGVSDVVLTMVKGYTPLKVKTIFSPTSSTTIQTAFNNVLSNLEFLIQIEVSPEVTEEQEDLFGGDNVI